jgi:hypothetical protein
MPVLETDALHERQIDDEAAVIRAVSGRAVAAPADRQQDSERSREVDGLLHVRGAQAPHDHRWPAIDVAVPDSTCLVIAGLPRDDDLAAHSTPQTLDVSVVHSGTRAGQRGRSDCHGVFPSCPVEPDTYARRVGRLPSARQPVRILTSGGRSPDGRAG